MQTLSQETPLMITKRNQDFYKLMTMILLWLLKKECFPRKLLQEKEQENSKNEVRPSKRRNLNPEIVPDDVDHFSEISEAQILSIDSKIPEYFQEFLSEELFSEIGKNIFKYTNLFTNMASRLIFMTIFL